MALDTLTAKANEGAGTDQLAGMDTAGGFAGAVVGTDGTNSERLATEATLEALTATLEEVARRFAVLADAVGVLSPDSAGRLRVAAETLGTLGTVSTVTNMSNIGGSAANQFIPTIALLGEGDLRRNIVIS